MKTERKEDFMETRLRIYTIRLLNKIKQKPEYKNYMEIVVKPREKLMNEKAKDE